MIFTEISFIFMQTTVGVFFFLNILNLVKYAWKKYD